MPFSAKTFIAVGGIVVLAITLFSWLSTRVPSSQPEVAPVIEETTPLPEKSRPLYSTGRPVQQETVVPQDAPPVAVVTNTINDTPDWEAPIDDTLRSNVSDKDKAKKLLEIFPTLPVEGQVEAAKHLSNLTADEDYAPLGRYLANAATAPEVLDELMSDLLNRPNALKLPFLLHIARNANHTKAADAKEVLVIYLGGDQGSDWRVWEQKVSEWLGANPD